MWERRQTGIRSWPGVTRWCCWSWNENRQLGGRHLLKMAPRAPAQNYTWLTASHLLAKHHMDLPFMLWHWSHRNELHQTREVQKLDECLLRSHLTALALPSQSLQEQHMVGYILKPGPQKKYMWKVTTRTGYFMWSTTYYLPSPCLWLWLSHGCL